MVALANTAVLEVDGPPNDEGSALALDNLLSQGDAGDARLITDYTSGVEALDASAVSQLLEEQHRAYNIIDMHLQQLLSGVKPTQLIGMTPNTYHPRHYPFATTDPGHTAWTFVLAPLSGPQQMRTWPDAEGLHTVGPDVSVFPENCAVAWVAFTVKDKPYLIYLIVTTVTVPTPIRLSRPVYAHPEPSESLPSTQYQTRTL